MANRYWVGGNGTWNTTSTTNWSASSGGAGGASVPTAADSVFFDQASTYTVSCGSASVVCLDFTVSAGTVTFTASTGKVTISGSMAITAGTVASIALASYTFNATSGTKTITTGGVTFPGDFIFDGVGGSWQLQDNVTISGNNPLTLTNGSLDLNNKVFTAATFGSNNTNTRTLAFGTGNITCYRGTAAGTTIVTVNATNLTITGTPTLNLTYAGALDVNLNFVGFSESNAFNISASAGTYALGFTASVGNSYVKNLNLTGFSGTLGSNTTITVNVYGNLTLGSASTFAYGTNSTINFAATSGTKTITTAGVTLGACSIVFNGAGGTFQFQDNFTQSNSSTTVGVTLTNGTVDLNGKTVTCNFLATGAGTKNLTFNAGTLVARNSTTTAWNNANPTNFTTTAGTGTGKISMTGATAKTFVGGGSTYNCTLSNDGAGALTVTGSNTFTTIANGVQPTTFTFTAGTTTTVTNWNVSGTSGNLVTIGSATAASHTLSKASGIVVSNYLSISRSTATGGATWYAQTTSVDGGNNSGWLFTSANVDATVNTVDGQDVNAASATRFTAIAAVWDLGVWDQSLWDGNIAYSATTDGADVNLAYLGISTNATSNTTDGSDLNNAIANLNSNAVSNTTDGSDIYALFANVNADATSTTTDGTDIYNISVSSFINAVSATTDGADVSSAIANVGPNVVVIDTHDGGDRQKKRFNAEAEEKKRRKDQLIAIYEDLLEAKPSIAEEIVAPFARQDKQDIYASIDFDALLSDLNRVDALYREHQEMDDEEVLLML